MVSDSEIQVSATSTSELRMGRLRFVLTEHEKKPTPPVYVTVPAKKNKKTKHAST